MTADLTRFFLGLGRVRGARKELHAGDAGTSIGTTNDGRLIGWPQPSRDAASHVLLLGASGTGKTVLAANALLTEMLSSPSGAESMLLVDPKGDLVELIFAGLAAIDPSRLSDVLYLNPFSSGGFAFNVNRLSLGATPVDIRSMQLANLVAETSTASGAQAHLGVGSRQVDVLQHLLLAALDTADPRASVLWTLDALTLRDGFARLGAITRSRRARDFLSSAKLSDELRASTAARLRTAFAASTALERLVSAPSSVQFGDLTAPGAIAILDLGQPTGGLQSLQRFWANMMLRLAIEHLMERPSPWSGHHVRIVIDEAQIVAPVLADVAERLLTTGRSRGLSLVLLSQGTTLIEDASHTLLRVILQNTSTRFIGRLAARDAELLGREQAPVPGSDEPIGAVRARFAAAVSNLKDREFFALLPGHRDRFTSASIDLSGWERSAATEHAAIQRAKERLALPASTLARTHLADLDPPARAGARGSGRRGAPRRRNPRSPWG